MQEAASSGPPGLQQLYPLALLVAACMYCFELLYQAACCCLYQAGVDTVDSCPILQTTQEEWP